MMNDDQFEIIKKEMADNTRLTREIYLTLTGTLDGKRGLNVRVGDLENTVDGPAGQPHHGLKHKVQEIDATRTKIIAYVAAGTSIVGFVWFVWDKVFNQKLPQF